MAEPGGSDVEARLTAIAEVLRGSVGADHEATVGAADQVAANSLIAEAVATLTGDPAIAKLAQSASDRSPAIALQPVLARDLLISVDLVARALGKR